MKKLSENLNLQTSARLKGKVSFNSVLNPVVSRCREFCLYCTTLASAKENFSTVLYFFRNGLLCSHTIVGRSTSLISELLIITITGCVFALTLSAYCRVLHCTNARHLENSNPVPHWHDYTSDACCCSEHHRVLLTVKKVDK